ncbi:MAG: rhamnogalacturonan acetylesterase [Colwellia sp.]
MKNQLCQLTCLLFTVMTLFSCASVAKEHKQLLSPKTIFIAGDSTAATYNKEDQQGWAGVLGQYFSSSVTIDNRARGGRSSRTFIREGLWQKLIDDVQAGDIVFIQFGHNDAGLINDDKRARGSLASIDFADKENSSNSININQITIDNLQTNQAETVYSFGHYIRQMVNDVRAKQATPILLSLTARNVWHGDRIERGSGQYGYWSYQLAWQLNTSFIDVTNPVADLLEAMGKVKTALLYPKDHTHFNPEGAHLHAKTIVAGLKGLRPTVDPTIYSPQGTEVEKNDRSWLRLPFVANTKLPSLFVVGDSTVRNGAGDGGNGEWGWGDFISENIASNKFNTVNRAVGGLSSRTFITGGHWQRALNMMKPGDYVLMQFGHNDAAPLNDNKRARGTIKGTSEALAVIDNQITKQQETVHSYGWYLRKMIGEAKAKGITPIICSPVPRKIWQNEKIKRHQDSYQQWAQQVARQSGSMFIDLHTLVAHQYDNLFDNQGPEAVDALFADKHTHTSKEGAKLTAKIVGQELKYLLGL